jgi:post-segregation antitoxin (ccd killing protein)
MKQTQITKKATNFTKFSLNSELLAEAKHLNINLSATMEKAVVVSVSQALFKAIAATTASSNLASVGCSRKY